MTDRLEELLLVQETEGEDVSWWKDGQRYARFGEQMSVFPSEQAAGKQDMVDGRRLDKLPESNRTRVWTARELERIRRAARRAAGTSGRGEAARQLKVSAEHAVGSKILRGMRDGSAGGRQRLTERIDMQFRRDARRYDGRLGLL